MGNCCELRYMRKALPESMLGRPEDIVFLTWQEWSIDRNTDLLDTKRWIVGEVLALFMYNVDSTRPVYKADMWKILSFSPSLSQTFFDVYTYIHVWYRDSGKKYRALVSRVSMYGVY